jgi:hypothetical protein
LFNRTSASDVENGRAPENHPVYELLVKST